MSTIAESWKRSEAHLRRAHEAACSPALAAFHDFLDQDELELAADVLADFGDDQEALPREFWAALGDAHENMELNKPARRCRYRGYEAEHGFVEARLADRGRRSHPADRHRLPARLGYRQPHRVR